MRAFVFVFGLFVAQMTLAHAQSLPAATPSPPARQLLSDTWWTGPLLAPGAGTLPHGHILIEPYFFDVIEYGAYDTHGSLQPATHANTYGSLTYLIYGLTDRFSVGLQPVFSTTSVSGGSSTSGIALGDWAILTQYKISQWTAERRVPTDQAPSRTHQFDP